MSKDANNQLNISVVYAVHNEADNLARSLDSIKDLADELIIVDGASTDDTVAIAQRYGAQVIETTNKPIFHINKQMAMDAARGRWILQMDADEVVDDEMAADIRRIAAANPTEMAAAYWLRRQNWFMGRFLTKGGQYPDPVIRFYQAGKARLPMETVHEQMTVDGKVDWLAGHLKHYSSPTLSDYLRKANAYTTLSAMEMAKQKLPLSFMKAVNYIICKPAITFFLLFFRHRGYMDGFPGFAFALLSGWHHILAYCKYWELRQTK
jgi:glycosyltransferase involved in cell wall biosynthesis